MSDKTEKKEDKVEKRETVEVVEKTVDVDKIRREEKNRAKDILTIGEVQGFQKEAIKAIDEGQTVEEFQRFVLDELGKRKKVTVDEPDPTIGLNDREAKTFSLIKLIRALHEPNNAAYQKDAGFELECSKAVSDKFGKKARGAFLPYDVLISRPSVTRAAVLEAARILKRDITTTDDASLIGTDHMAGSFIDVLRNKMYVKQAGARVLEGLVGNVSIPKKTASSTLYWVAEGITTAPTESEATYGAVTLSPKTSGTYTEITRQMLNQSSPAIDQLTKDDLAGTVAVGLDAAALHGTGANDQPTGIAATSGIGSVVGGTNGAAPDWADIVNLETEVAVDNADIGALAYMTNTKVRGKLKQTLVTATYGDVHVWERGSKTPLNDYPCYVTNNVSSTLTKGSASAVCSAIFFGNWSDLLIGMWGTLDILVDPYTYSKSGGLLIRALQDIDIAVRHAESFAAMLDALTT